MDESTLEQFRKKEHFIILEALVVLITYASGNGKLNEEEVWDIAENLLEDNKYSILDIDRTDYGLMDSLGAETAGRVFAKLMILGDRVVDNVIDCVKEKGFLTKDMHVYTLFSTLEPHIKNVLLQLNNEYEDLISDKLNNK